MSVLTAPTEVPSALVQPLSWVGMRWPEGDATQLAAAGDGWVEAGRALRERRTNADAAAARVWTANRGLAVDSYHAWWTAADGPTANLGRAVEACEEVGAALKGLAAQVSGLKATYVSCLTAMVNALDRGGLLVADGQGGVAVRSGGEAIIAQTRSTMQAAQQRAVEVANGQLLGFVDEAKQKTKPAPKPPTPRRPPPRPMRPGGPLRTILEELLRQIIEQLIEGKRGRQCPDPDLPNRPWDGGGRPNLETYPDQGYILQIRRETLSSGARVIDMVGQVVEPERDAQGLVVRQGWEQDISNAAPGMWIPGAGPEGYHGSHLWGPVLGTEAREGILLAPGSVNIGVQAQIENQLQALRRQVEADGGYVFMQARMETYAPQDWNQGNPMVPSGTNLVRSVNYDVFVCRADGTFVPYGRYGYDVSLPTGSIITENFRAGQITAVRMGVPLPTR